MARLKAATHLLSSCEICSHRCHADRRAGPAGRCGAGVEPNIFSAQVEVGDELEIIPAYTIALAGCNLRCSFCITGDQSWHPQRGIRIDAATAARNAADAIRSGRAKSVQILGGEPTLYLPWLLQLAATMPDSAPLVLKTNGLSSTAAREVLAGLFDTWIVDFKFGNDDCAAALSRTPGYLSSIGQTLRWASENTDLIIRHLLLPGHVECCWQPISAWIATHLPSAKVSLRSGYWPSWKALRSPPLNRPLASAELAEATRIAQRHQLRLIP